MALAPDPADKGADQFQPAPTIRRTGGWTLAEWLDWLARWPDAAMPSGVGGMLAAEIRRLRNEVSLLHTDLERLESERG